MSLISLCCAQCDSADNSFVFSHFYTDAGKYTVTVRVTDDDGGVEEVKRTINIKK